jgi:hypothetical protein
MLPNMFHKIIIKLINWLVAKTNVMTVIASRIFRISICVSVTFSDHQPCRRNQEKVRVGVRNVVLGAQSAATK